MFRNRNYVRENYRGVFTLRFILSAKSFKILCLVPLSSGQSARSFVNLGSCDQDSSTWLWKRNIPIYKYHIKMFMCKYTNVSQREKLRCFDLRLIKKFVARFLMSCQNIDISKDLLFCHVFC